MKKFILAAYLFLVPTISFGKPVPFESANTTNDSPYPNFYWDDANEGFTLSNSGLLSSKSKSTNPKLKLPIDKGFWIDGLNVQRSDSDFILAIGLTNSEDAGGIICRVKWPQNKVQWCQNIPGFNMHVSSSNGYLYVGAIGLMSKIDPANGHFIWRHDGLYEKDHSLNIVCLTDENKTTVTFNASSGSAGANSAIEQILLDSNTGKILQTSVVGTGYICRNKLTTN